LSFKCAPLPQPLGGFLQTEGDAQPEEVAWVRAVGQLAAQPLVDSRTVTVLEAQGCNGFAPRGLPVERVVEGESGHGQEPYRLRLADALPAQVVTAHLLARHVVTYRHSVVRRGSMVALVLIDCNRKSPRDLRQVARALGRETPARRTPFGKKGGRAMTRTRTRTHTTPPSKRPVRVAPVGFVRSSSLLGSSDFRAGGQHGQISAREAESS
jgi:hypothetical protein